MVGMDGVGMDGVGMFIMISKVSEDRLKEIFKSHCKGGVFDLKDYAGKRKGNTVQRMITKKMEHKDFFYFISFYFYF